MSILRSEVNNISGINAVDAGACLAFAVYTYCPEHIDKIVAWSNAHH